MDQGADSHPAVARVAAQDRQVGVGMGVGQVVSAVVQGDRQVQQIGQPQPAPMYR